MGWPCLLESTTPLRCKISIPIAFTIPTIIIMVSHQNIPASTTVATISAFSIMEAGISIPAIIHVMSRA
ncbi:hypothetical protein PHJA_002766000 [Phtheirospermum japonicum]|uniref:Uncharacterized protein n=1 Tax=Phtheirospermum japonicum TaxID=374723 RepID=A0A830D4L3_9LAMI|nr:hypothetical protein PHJA_002766000 [Phtheirospermum japonicum]